MNNADPAFGGASGPADVSVETTIPQEIVSLVRARYFSALERFPLPLHDLGQRVMERMVPSRWTLEWGLPYWLGQAMQLSAEISTELIASNVFGLAYIRLMDDLTDGEVEEPARLPATLLAHQLYQEAVLNYIKFFPSGSPFWNHLKLWMDEWLAATLPSSEPQPITLVSYEDQDFLRLAHRGAPLKICCAAACLLADRGEAIPSLALALDHALVALVLLDHFQDWEVDLEAGRFNAFIAHASGLEQSPVNRVENRRRVLEALYLEDRGRPYLELVRKNLRVAKHVDIAIEIPQFAWYLADLEARADGFYDRLIDEHRVMVRDLTEQIFGPLTNADPPSAVQEGGQSRTS